MSARFLLPWIILQQNGEILAAHCTRMAGLGEACSHIAAITWCMINARETCQQTGADSCTSTLCGWSHSAPEVRMNNAQHQQWKKAIMMIQKTSQDYGVTVSNLVLDK